MKIAVVSGSSGFLGTVIVENLKRDYFVVGLDKVESSSPQICVNEYIRCDLSNQEQLNDRGIKLSKKFPNIDLLINLAAAKPKGFFYTPEEYMLSDWNQILAVNVTSYFILAKNLFPSIKNASGCIINFGSIYGSREPRDSMYRGAIDSKSGKPLSNPLAYSVTKSAVLGLTRHLAMAWGKHGIRVNCIAPGGVENNHNDEFVKSYSDVTALGRMAKPEDIVGAVNYLISPAANYVTGTTLTIDGGWSI
jgi:NAD(P)-dependent dehydrogenase (short-subunit alcohol dehydrogenase family)